MGTVKSSFWHSKERGVLAGSSQPLWRPSPPFLSRLIRLPYTLGARTREVHGPQGILSPLTTSKQGTSMMSFIVTAEQKTFYQKKKKNLNNSLGSKTTIKISKILKIFFCTDVYFNLIVEQFTDMINWIIHCAFFLSSPNLETPHWRIFMFARHFR